MSVNGRFDGVILVAKEVTCDGIHEVLKGANGKNREPEVEQIGTSFHMSSYD